MFTQKFDAYVCDCDKIECVVNGLTVTATVRHDDSPGTPWENCDGHGPVSEWTRREAEEGEVILAQDHGSYRYYDMAEAIKLAKADRWGYTNDEGVTVHSGNPCGLTADEIATNAAQSDFENLKAWCEDRWFYVGVVLEVSRNGIVLSDSTSLWGIEANYPGKDKNAYLTEVANELLPEALEDAQKQLAALALLTPGGPAMADAIDVVLKAARRAPDITEYELAACDTVEDFATNHLGED